MAKNNNKQQFIMQWDNDLVHANITENDALNIMNLRQTLLLAEQAIGLHQPGSADQQHTYDPFHHSSEFFDEFYDDELGSYPCSEYPTPDDYTINLTDTL